MERKEVMELDTFGGPLIADFGAKALPRLVQYYHSGEYRNTARVGIGYMRDEAATLSLIELTDGSDIELANVATSALGEIRYASKNNKANVIKKLMSLTKSVNSSVRAASVSSLVRLDAASQLTYVEKMIERESSLALPVFYALMKSPTPEAVPFLKEFIKKDEMKTPESYTAQRLVAAQAIYRISGEKVPFKGLEDAKRIYSDPYNP
jgi:HEAT repeat protein